MKIRKLTDIRLGRFLPVLLILFLPVFVTGQQPIIKGKVTDAVTNESLPGVNVMLNDKTGIATDEKGKYLLKPEPGKNTLTFSFMGYKTEIRTVNIKIGQSIVLNIVMETKSTVFDEIVVSAGKFEQKLSEVTVSMVVLKPKLIESNNTMSLETAIQKVPGIMVVDGQTSIRGGSGYSYGAGSRVLLLVDDLPMLTGAVGEARWDFVPIENIEQVEIIKGASSALYGSSALNGVINIRTAYPHYKPVTKVLFYNGIYDNPKRKEIRWWGSSQPSFTGTQFSHSRKIGNLDIVFGGSGFYNNSYRENELEQRIRLNLNTRYHSKKFEGLFYGFNTNLMDREGDLFLLWLDGDTGVYQASSSYLQDFHNSYFNIDPYIVYYRNNKSRHSLRTRFYTLANRNNTQQNNYDDQYYGEYQFQRHFLKKSTFTCGLVAKYSESESQIYGKEMHFSSNGGGYAQFDGKFNRLTVSIGGRWEVFKLDDETANSKPVFRTGLNFKLADHSFLRASFGQGYRYPTIAEKYTNTQVGNLKIFPNNELNAENGWSAEIGIKQGFKISDWRAYLDVAGFWMEYQDMIEFTFGQHYPESLTNPSLLDFFYYTGFKAHNVSNAQITGIDVSINGNGNFFGLPVSLLAGYTYTNPIDLDAVDIDTLTTSNNNILKYRFYHNVKADVEINLKKIFAGISIDYHSFIINIDKAFEDTMKWPNGQPMQDINGTPLMILPGLYEYREKHNKGDIIFDFRLGYQTNNKIRISLIIKNIFNREYMIRPGDVQAPRNSALQIALKL